MDDEPLTYSIIGGANKDLFTIGASGELSFLEAPDFEYPNSDDGDNKYDVIVAVSDKTNSVSQAITVTVTDDPNDGAAPVIAPIGLVQVPENKTFVTTVVATDADSDPTSLGYSIDGGAHCSRSTRTENCPSSCLRTTRPRPMLVRTTSVRSSSRFRTAPTRASRPYPWK